MTEPAAAVTPVWVLEAMCLSHFARAERLDVLGDLLVDKECWTTQVVLEELRQGAWADGAGAARRRPAREAGAASGRGYLS